MIFKPWDCAQPDEWLPQSLRLCWGDSGSGWSGDSGGGGWSGDTGGGWGGATTGGGDWGSSGTYDASGFNAGGDVNAWAGTAYDASTAGTGAGGGGDWGSFGTASFPDSSPGAIFTDIAGPNPGVTTGGGDWGSAGTSSFAGTGGGPGGSMFGDYGGGGGGGGGGGFWGSTESGGGGSYGGGGGTYGGGGGGGGAFGGFGSGTLGGSNAYAAAPTGPTGSAFADSYGGGSVAGPAGQVSSGAPTTSEAQSESAGGGETTSEGDAAPEGETAPAQSDFGTPTTSEAAPEADPGPSLSDGAPAGNIGGKDDAAPAAAPTADRGETETAAPSAFGPQSLDADYQGSPYSSDYDQSAAPSQSYQQASQQLSDLTQSALAPVADTTNWGAVFEGAAPTASPSIEAFIPGDRGETNFDYGQGQQTAAPNFDQVFADLGFQPGWNPAEQLAGRTGLVEPTDWAANPYQPSTDVSVGRDFNQAFDPFGDTPTGMDLAGDLATPEGDINPNSLFQAGWAPANAYEGRGEDYASGRADPSYPIETALAAGVTGAIAPGLLAGLSPEALTWAGSALGGSAITGGLLSALMADRGTTPIDPQQTMDVTMVDPKDVPAPPPPPPPEQQPQEVQPTPQPVEQPAQVQQTPMELRPIDVQPAAPQETQPANPEAGRPAEVQPTPPQEAQPTPPQEAQPAPPSLVDMLPPPALTPQVQPPGVPPSETRPAETPAEPGRPVEHDDAPEPQDTSQPPQDPNAPRPPENIPGQPIGARGTYTNSNLDNPRNNTNYRDSGRTDYPQGRPGIDFRTARQAGIEPHFRIGDINVHDLDARLVERINRAMEDMPANLRDGLVATSGWRPAHRGEAHEHGMDPRTSQESVYTRYNPNGRNVGPAAPPGGSNHGPGRAIDFQPGPALSWLRTNAGRYGLETLGRNFDIPHIQLQGARGIAGVRPSPQEQQAQRALDAQTRQANGQAPTQLAGVPLPRGRPTDAPQVEIAQPQPPEVTQPAALPPPNAPQQPAPAPVDRPPADIPAPAPFLSPPARGRADPKWQTDRANAILKQATAHLNKQSGEADFQAASVVAAKALAAAGIPLATARSLMTKGAYEGAEAVGFGPSSLGWNTIYKGRIDGGIEAALQGYNPAATGPTPQGGRYGPGPVQGPQGFQPDIRALAKGGHVDKDEPVVVGEEGPEYFVPDQPGTVFPHIPQPGKPGNIDRWPRVPNVEQPGLYGGVEREIRRQTRAAQNPLPSLIDMIDSGRLPLNEANWRAMLNDPALIALGRSRMDDRREGIDPGAEQYGAFIPAPAPAAEPPDPTSQMAQALGYGSIKRRPMQIGRQSYSQ